MRRRILPMILAAILLTAVLPQTGSAAGMDLAPVRTYQGQFADVQPTDWYYDNVAALYALGLTDGQGSTDYFVPAADITIAEAVTMAARCGAFICTGTVRRGRQPMTAATGTLRIPPMPKQWGSLERNLTGSIRSPAVGPKWPISWPIRSRIPAGTYQRAGRYGRLCQPPVHQRCGCLYTLPAGYPDFISLGNSQRC